MKRQTTWLIALLAGLTAMLSAQDVPWVIDKNGKRWVGTSIRSSSTGIELSTASGSKSFVPGSYLRVYKPKPNELIQAEKLFYQGQYDSAMPMLEAVEKANRNLNWDTVAGQYRVRCLIEKKQPDKAMEVVNTMQASAGAKDNPFVVGSELEALIAQGKADAANRKIDDYIASGNRQVAAISQLRRGDVNVNKDLYDAAVLDYLRTVVFYKDVNPEILAEATYKTGVALKKKKDATRAQRMFQKTQKDYPNTYWAFKAKNP